ncbi:MAG: hypothetical protein Q8P81_00930 [Nanoarchaeota archaeon]|nr:hypothetical protein [Nanoarchaeota archaeon]
MTNITLSIEDEVYKRMRKFSEIKWSEFVRKCINQRVEELERVEEGVFADRGLLAENWLSEEDNKAWKDL